jgi:hypothetical protein
MHDSRSHEMTERVQEAYIDAVTRLYAEGRLRLGELEDLLDLVLEGETRPREFRERVQGQYGIELVVWVPELEGEVVYV